MIRNFHFWASTLRLNMNRTTHDSFRTNKTKNSNAFRTLFLSQRTKSGSIDEPSSVEHKIHFWAKMKLSFPETLFQQFVHVKNWVNWKIITFLYPIRFDAKCIDFRRSQCTLICSEKFQAKRIKTENGTRKKMVKNAFRWCGISLFYRKF